MLPLLSVLKLVNLMTDCKIYIVDDEDTIRKSLGILLISAGYQTETFKSAEEFLKIQDFDSPGCIILDIFLEGRSGLDLQEDIQRKFFHLPVIYITGQGDIPMSVKALKTGAVNFLQKPVDDSALLSAIEDAIKQSKDLLQEQSVLKHYEMLIQSLTPREYQIFRLVIKGFLNKQIAGELNITEHTVKLHRGKVTGKLGVKSVPEMISIASKLNLT